MKGMSTTRKKKPTKDLVKIKQKGRRRGARRAEASQDKKRIKKEEYLLIGDKCDGNGRHHLDIVWH